MGESAGLPRPLVAEPDVLPPDDAASPVAGPMASDSEHGPDICGYDPRGIRATDQGDDP